MFFSARRPASFPVRVLAGIALALTLVLAGGCTGDASRTQPNVVVILADDLGYGDVGAYNPDARIPTPHMDRLAEEGIRLTDAHSPSAVCTPTRYGLLTGRYAWRTRLKSGVLWGDSPALIDTGRVTLASFLQNRGYETIGVGKWHLGLGRRDSTHYDEPLRPGPTTAGFDHYFGIPASLDMPPYVYVQDDTVRAPPTAYVEGSAHRREGGGGFWRAGRRAPGFEHREVLPTLGDRAVEHLRRQAGAEDPFFLYLPLSAPHTPWLPTDPFRGRSEAGYYGDFVTQVDAVVGRVTNTLDSLGLGAETLLVVTSDNGAHWPEADVEQWGHDANGGWRGQKADIWEGGHRVPFLARWPGRIPADTTSGQTLSLTDLPATVAAAVGAELPPGAGPDSYNMLPALLGEAPDRPMREATVHHSLDGMFALRKGPWKLILGRGSGGFTDPRRRDVSEDAPPGQLYHLGRDPEEQNNRYAERPALVDSLRSLLDRYRRQGYSRPGFKPAD
jgi:arylsulfatase A-like enzyme